MLIEPRTVKLTTRTGVAVHRTLPHRDLKMVGAWCFVDHFGPTPQTDGMVVAAHPHTGLQTASWLIEGAIEHRDSLGTVQLIQPGQLNLMTAGHGIAHSELSLASDQSAGPQNLHAVQLWIALPKDSIDTAPEFEHQADLPKVEGEGFTATVLAGEFLGARAATKTFSEMMGAELRFAAGATTEIELNPEFEYGFMLAAGELTVDGQAVPTSGLYFVPAGAESVAIEAAAGSIVLMLGGKPFGEKILMWWNFIGRTQADVSKAREEWNAQTGERFGKFEDQIGGWIPAPELPNVQLSAR
jgi:redox-sensitive bicupin YhaK (pirin superfamily)